MDLRQRVGQVSRRVDLLGRHAATHRFPAGPFRQDHARRLTKALFPLLSVLWIASIHAEPTEWLEGTVLAACEYCKTDAFRTERKTLANQLGPKRDPASGMGYVVTVDPDGRFVWGRAALVGTG